MSRVPSRWVRFGHMLPFLLIAAGLGVAAVIAEYRLRGTILLLPAEAWLSEPLRAGRVAGPLGDYSLSFANTRYDWRLYRRARPGQDPALVAGVRRRWRLEVSELPGGAGKVPEGAVLVETASGGLHLQVDGSVEGLAHAGAKDLLLRFVEASPGQDARYDERLQADMREIAASVKPAAMKGP